MRTHIWLLTLLIVAANSLASAVEPKLNVLFVMADDLNCDLGCYGSTLVKSPQIDRLAARGVQFDRAYCNYPVCNPSRTSMLTGLLPDHTRVVDNFTPPRSALPSAMRLPEHFRHNGYRTLKVGKIYHTGKEFEDPQSWDVDIVETAESKSPPREQIIPGASKQGIVLSAPDENTWDGHVARRAVELLEQSVAKDKPFFLAVGFRRPHNPYMAPKKYFDLYPLDGMNWAQEPADHVQGIPPIALTYKLGSPPAPESRRAGLMQAYYASVSFMDAQVGVLLDALDRLKLWDTTVVVFVSDHGYHLGEHGGLQHKMTLFEESARVPLSIAAPGHKSGVRSARVVELIDLFPTLIELCGLPKAGNLDGRSLVPLLDDSQKDWPADVVTVVGRVGNIGFGAGNGKLDPDRLGRSIRTERWRYTLWPDGSEELYDHDADPHEWKNLAGSSEFSGVVAELKKRLAERRNRSATTTESK